MSEQFLVPMSCFWAMESIVHIFTTVKITVVEFFVFGITETLRTLTELIVCCTDKPTVISLKQNTALSLSIPA